jgi:hypothetical protein
MIKYTPALVLVLLVGCGPAPQAVQTAQPEKPKTYGPDGCNIDVSSKLATEHEVGPIRNLVKEEFQFGYKNECSVEFDITVDGKDYHLKDTETGLEQMPSVCYYARERARKNLLLDLGGKFQSKADIDCRYTDTIGKPGR